MTPHVSDLISGTSTIITYLISHNYKMFVPGMMEWVPETIGAHIIQFYYLTGMLGGGKIHYLCTQKNVNFFVIYN